MRKSCHAVFESLYTYSIVWFSSKVATLNSNFLMVYSSENILFLYLHFTWLYSSWNHQRILKKHPFWKYTAIVWFSIKVTTPNSLMVYSSGIILFLYLHFTWLYGSWNHQRILKKHPFWKYDSWFSSDVSKPTSVKYPWNQAWQKLIFTNIAP